MSEKVYFHKNTKVALQGSPGSFSEAALFHFFDSTKTVPLFCSDFEQVFFSVSKKKCQYGIVPIENSLIGTIYACVDKFLTYKDISIVGHTQIQIEHTLIGLRKAKVSDITTVYSQLPGLEQCTKFLSKQKVHLVPFRDTAAAVEHVAEKNDIHKAAVASERAAKIYKLKVLVKNIENNSQNFTRFAVIKKQRTNITSLKKQDEQNLKVGFIIFTTEDSPGALLECLKTLNKFHINLHKIESRPIVGKPWEYQFVVELDIAHKKSNVIKALEELSKITPQLRIVGLYNKQKTDN